MDENRSLTDFATGDESSSDDSDVEDDADAGAEAESAASEDADTVDPAVSTYRWSGEGAACADCGETVERRWRDGDAYVCGDCKEW